MRLARRRRDPAHSGRRVLAAFLAFGLVACQVTEPERAQPLPKRELLPRDDASLVLLEPPAQLFAPSSEGVRLQDLSARDADVATLFFSLFEGGDVNLLVDDSVQGTLSFDFRDTTLEEGFLSLLDLAGLAFRREGDFVIVTGFESKTLEMDYPVPVESDSSETESLDLWQVLEENLSSLVADDDGSTQVVMNPLAGKIVISGSPSNVQRAEAYLAEVQESVDRQVIVETEVFEVSLSREFRLGVSYSFFPDFLNSQRNGLLADGSALAQTNSAGGTALRFGLLKRDSYAALVDMLQQMGETRILSSPRVAALNNRPARISVSEQVPIIERTIIDTDSSTREQFNVRFEDAGIVVDLVPQIGRDGEIVVQLTPSITEVTGFVSTPDGLQTQPILNVRETTTTLRVRDGQSIVIGGLRSVRRSEQVQGVPFLMDIPLLGALFRSTVQKDQETELVIVMTPRILTPDRIRELVGIERERLVDHSGQFHFGRWMSPTDREPRPGGILEELAQGDVSEEQPTRLPAEALVVEATSSTGLSRVALARGLVDRARLALIQDDYLEARRSLTRAASLDRLDGWVDFWIGLTAFSSGDLESARQHFRRAVATDDSQPLFLCNLGVLAARTDRLDLAVRMLERATQLAPEEPAIRSNLGAVYEAVGRLDDAIAQYKEALRLRPEQPEASARLEQLTRPEVGEGR